LEEKEKGNHTMEILTMRRTGEKCESDLAHGQEQQVSGGMNFHGLDFGPRFSHVNAHCTHFHTHTHPYPLGHLLLDPTPYYYFISIGPCHAILPCHAGALIAVDMVDLFHHVPNLVPGNNSCSHM
jgi:hypothetical protein